MKGEYKMKYILTEQEYKKIKSIEEEGYNIVEEILLAVEEEGLEILVDSEMAEWLDDFLGRDNEEEFEQQQ